MNNTPKASVSRNKREGAFVKYSESCMRSVHIGNAVKAFTGRKPTLGYELNNHVLTLAWLKEVAKAT